MRNEIINYILKDLINRIKILSIDKFMIQQAIKNKSKTLTSRRRRYKVDLEKFKAKRKIVQYLQANLK